MFLLCFFALYKLFQPFFSNITSYLQNYCSCKLANQELRSFSTRIGHLILPQSNGDTRCETSRVLPARVSTGFMPFSPYQMRRTSCLRSFIITLYSEILIFFPSTIHVRLGRGLWTRIAYTKIVQEQHTSLSFTILPCLHLGPGQAPSSSQDDPGTAPECQKSATVFIHCIINLK